MVYEPSPSDRPHTRLLVVDHDAIRRDALMQALSAELDCIVMGEATCGKQALTRIPHLQVDLVLIEVRMPFLDGITITRVIRTEFPQVCVVGMCVSPTAKEAAAMREAGAAACVDKNDPHAVIAAVRLTQDQAHGQSPHGTRSQHAH
jgi:DNA-binding NarL/FixJ family response regulator